jgi:hypothetical protein
VVEEGVNTPLPVCNEDGEEWGEVESEGLSETETEDDNVDWPLSVVNLEALLVADRQFVGVLEKEVVAVKVNADEKVKAGEGDTQAEGLTEEHSEVDQTDDGVALAQPEIENEGKGVELAEGHKVTEREGDRDAEVVALSDNEDVGDMVMLSLPVPV